MSTGFGLFIRTRYFVIHRADFQEVLYQIARSLGVMVFFSHPVKTVKEEIPCAVLADGREMRAEVVVAADGKSKVCSRLL